MKWSPTGWSAEIEEGEKSYMREVERWGDGGEALVADRSGRLIPATKVPGFKELVPNHRVVAVVPAAAGWTAEAAPFGPFPAYTAAIAAWVMDGEGEFWPVIGVSEPADGGPMRPSLKGESVLRPHWSSGLKIVPPTE